jgi:VCBS repeat-containing protein
MFKRFVVSGTNEDNILTGTDRLDIIFGRKGNDVLDGLGGKDFLFGGKGDDQLFGGDGNDFLFGDKGNDQLFGDKDNDFLFGGKGIDFLDGGAGSDRIIAGKGDDTVNFTLSENIGARDYYDGGKGFDTLQLTLTSAELLAAQPEIDAFREFVADGGKVFHFESLGLTVRNFEHLRVEPADGGNTAPVAVADEFPATEDEPIEGNVLVNDTDVEDVKPTAVSAVNGDTSNVDAEITLASGALLTVNQNGTFSYDPNGKFEELGVGDFAEDSFTYVAQDSQGANSDNAAEVTIVIAGVNDAPVAGDDIITESAVDGRIRVMVIGGEDNPETIGPVENSTYDLAAGFLDQSIFSVLTMEYTEGKNWTGAFDGFNVVVLGDSGVGLDYNSTTNLFSSLRAFVDGGNGVVTTGWFARALENIHSDNSFEDQIRLDADYITPIAPNGFSFAGNTSHIAVLDSNPDIVNEGFDISVRFWELANAIDPADADPSTADATPLATGPTGTAIAYDAEVGMGRTVYLGGMYMAHPDHSPELTREDPVLDGIFERAIAWAAGARGDTATTVIIDDALLLAYDTDVDSPHAELKINSVALQDPLSGAAISLDANGDVVYTPSAAGLQQLLAGQAITDSFDYTIIDGDLATSLAASVSLTVDTLL